MTVRSAGRARRSTTAGPERRAPDPQPGAAPAAAPDDDSDPEDVARAIALRLLTSAPRSRAELARAMAARAVPEQAAEAVLDRFTEVGLVDDAEYARMLVRSRQAERGLARRGLAAELNRHGVPPEAAAQALAEVDDESELATARDLVRRRMAAGRGLDEQVLVRRTVAALARKGYAPGLALRLVREALATEGADVDLAGTDLLDE